MCGLCTFPKPPILKEPRIARFQRWGAKFPFQPNTALYQPGSENALLIFWGPTDSGEQFGWLLTLILERTSGRNSPIGSSSHSSEHLALTPVQGPDGKASCHLPPSRPLPAGLCPFFSMETAQIPEYINRCKQTWATLVMKAITYAGWVWDQFLLNKYVMMFNSGYYAGEIFQNHVSTPKVHPPFYSPVCGRQPCVNVVGAQRGQQWNVSQADLRPGLFCVRCLLHYH